MPLFVIISGYLTKKLKKETTIYYLLIYLIIQFVVTALFDDKIQFVYPTTALWFLLALFFWRIMLYFYKDFKKPLLISVIVALILGFSDEIGSILQLRRAIMFFPFFWIGYKIPLGNYHKYLKLIKKYQSLLLNIVVIIVIAILFLVYDIPYQNRWYSYGLSYSKLLENSSDLFGPLIQIGIYLSSLMVSLLIATIVPKRRLPLVTKMGENSLVIYIVHIIIWQYFEQIGFYDDTPHPILLFLISFCISILFSSRYFSLIFNKIFHSKLLKNNFFI
jgi:fucose 4-O-acetylase-like acetyltransferase